MNKTLFFVIAAVLGFITIFLLIIIMVVQMRKEELAHPLPTPTLIPSPTAIVDFRPSIKPTVVSSVPLAVVSTDPADQATNVFIDTDITITFNKKFTQDDFIVAITPDSKFRLSINTVKLQAYVQFNKNLQPNTTYTFKVNTFKQLPKTFTFTTGEATGAAKINR